MMLLIDAAELTAATRRVFAAAGSARVAETIRRPSGRGNLKGHDSHGVGMIPSFCANLGGGKVKPNEPGRIVSDSGRCRL